MADATKIHLFNDFPGNSFYATEWILNPVGNPVEGTLFRAAGLAAVADVLYYSWTLEKDDIPSSGAGWTFMDLQEGLGLTTFDYDFNSSGAGPGDYRITLVISDPNDAMADLTLSFIFTVPEGSVSADIGTLHYIWELARNVGGSWEVSDYVEEDNANTYSFTFTDGSEGQYRLKATITDISSVPPEILTPPIITEVYLTIPGLSGGGTLIGGSKPNVII